MLPEGWPEHLPIGKVLLLGAGETGKSTILKQMHLLYGQRNHLDDALFRMWMRRNAIESAKQLVKLAEAHKLALDDADKAMVLQLEEVATPEQAATLAALWQAGSLKQAVEINRAEPTTWLLDQAPFYLDQVERIFSTEYMPSEHDIVKTRVLTIGVNTFHFSDEVPTSASSEPRGDAQIPRGQDPPNTYLQRVTRPSAMHRSLALTSSSSFPLRHAWSIQRISNAQTLSCPGRLSTWAGSAASGASGCTPSMMSSAWSSLSGSSNTSRYCTRMPV